MEAVLRCSVDEVYVSSLYENATLGTKGSVPVSM